MSYGNQALSFCTSGSLNLRPIRRFTEKMVFFGFVTDWRFASSPTRRSLDLEIAAIDGVVRLPSAFSRMRGSPPSMTATAEFVVPKSIPKIFGMLYIFNYIWRRYFSLLTMTLAGLTIL